MALIKNIEIFEVGEPSGNTASQWSSIIILVKMTTVDGYVGWGEAPTELMALSVYQQIREISRIFLNKEVTEVRRNIEEVYKHDYWLAVSMQSTSALSAFEMASWNIIGKIYGIPVYKIFGGEYNKEIRAYANAWYDGCVTPDEFVAKAKLAHNKGFSALKFDPFGDAFDNIDKEHLDHARNIISSLKQELPEMDLLIECHGRFNANSAIRIAHSIAEYNPLFMEEPVHPEQMEGLARFRQETNMPVALGERVLNNDQLIVYLKNNLVDIIQPDVANFKGLMEAYSASTMARSFGVEVAFHNAYGPVQNCATLNIDFTMPNFLIQESFEVFWPEWKRKIIKKSNFKLESGSFKIVDKLPGLGMEIDEDIIDKYKVNSMGPYLPQEPGWVVKDTYKIKR
jgi:L-alanine-DL-glutamate epimerase-like enolase superfamily enzyme